jgi:hypothetical protein
LHHGSRRLFPTRKKRLNRSNATQRVNENNILAHFRAKMAVKPAHFTLVLENQSNFFGEYVCFQRLAGSNQKDPLARDD